ncbi:beta family protein [Xanthomonas arboricola]
MRKYTPFLKMKVNEVGALQALPEDVFPKIVPFFDLPHNKDRNLQGLDKLISDSSKKMKKLADRIPKFFLDLHDIPDGLANQGIGAFNSVALAFQTQDFIPVIGLDRSAAYLSSVFLSQSSGLLTSKTLAIRLVDDDYQSYAACKSDISILVANAKSAGFIDFILVLDMRVCISKLPLDLASSLLKFIGAVTQASIFKEIIVTGSSITAQIVAIVPTETTLTSARVELDTFNLINALPRQLVGFGDYTVVSPDYSETDFPKELLRNITAPKICYPYDNVHYIARGGALKTHRRGNAQYNDMAAKLVAEPFFRQAGYSFGEDFLIEKASGQGSAVTPSSILKPTICAHMTYMVRAHPLFV